MFHVNPLLVVMLVWMQSLVPGVDHWRVAEAVVSVVEREPALYREDPLKLRTLALVTAVSFRESAFKGDAVGDSGNSFCLMQIHRSSGGTRELLSDPEACVTKGMQMLRQSIAVDREHPIAWYARGPRYQSIEAIRISNDRVAIARKLLAQSSD